MVVGLLGNESPDLNRFILVNPKSENDVRLQATIGNQNPTGLPVGAVSFANHYLISQGGGMLIIPEKEVPEFKKLLVAFYEDRDNSIYSFMKDRCIKTF